MSEEETQPYIPDDEPESGEEGAGWLMTYGDLMTLLLTFFILLFSMSETKMDKFAQLVQSLRSAIGKEDVPMAGTREGLEMLNMGTESKPEAVDELGGMVQAELDSIQSEVEEFIMKNKLGGQVQVKQDGRGAVITISDLVLFPPGETAINPEGLDILNKVKDMLKQFDYHIKVEGHTDNRPINTELFPSNWELSANRASRIVRYLIENGIPPEQLSAEGFAEYRPVGNNNTVEGRNKNRRVEIVYERGSIERMKMGEMEGEMKKESDTEADN
ncbi:MAG: flagellar motor protein MotB [Fidelibacterota bacterium]